ncbi:MAG: PQQ-binding-like beta-propeller repeat protein [Pseudomonadota bacterium]
MIQLHSILKRIAMTALVAGSIGLAGCGAGERLSQLNPFGGEETDDPNAPAQSERIPILAIEDQLARADAFGTPVDLPPAYVNDRWPQPDGFPTHAMQHTQASGPLTRLWRVDIGEGSSRSTRLNARPVVADGAVYAIDGSGRVSAHDAETGARRWVTRLSAEAEAESGGRLAILPFVGGADERLSFGGGLALDGGRLFVHAGFEYIVALDVATGEEIWRQTAFTPFHSAPTAVDGRVFVATDDNELMALDAANGEVLWTHRGISETARLITSPSPAVLGEVVIAPYTSGELVALRVQNGSVLWSDSLTRAGGFTPMSTINDIAASPVIVNDQVYAMSHSGVMAAFDMRSGERVWTQPAGSLHAPSAAGDFLFFVTTDGDVVAMERGTGAARWITELPAFENERRRRDRIAYAGPILAGDRLLVASSRGRLHVLNPTNGALIGERDLDDPVFIAPVIANETVYILTDDARLIALR